MFTVASGHSLESRHRLLWYRIVRVLSQGEYGITYLAEDLRSHKSVVIKELFPSQYCLRKAGSDNIKPISNEAEKSFKWCLERFLGDARSLAGIKHPNIARVLDVFEANDTAYLAMSHEHRGVSLAHLLKRPRALNESKLVKVAIPIMGALEEMHEAGLIHRDIKPVNIHIREDGTPVLLDSGMVRQPGKSSMHGQSSIETQGYSPLELYADRSEAHGPWTDIYSMGATLYRAVTGEIPPSALARHESISKGRADRIIPASELVSELMLKAYSMSFLSAIDHALALKIQDRPHNISAWREEFCFASAATASEQVKAELSDENTDNKEELADKIYEELADGIDDTEAGIEDPKQNDEDNGNQSMPSEPRVPADWRMVSGEDLISQFSMYRDTPAASVSTDSTNPVGADESGDKYRTPGLSTSEPTTDELEALLLGMTPSDAYTDPVMDMGKEQPVYPRRRRLLDSLMMGGLCIVAGGLLGVFLLSQLADPIWDRSATDIVAGTETDPGFSVDSGRPERSDTGRDQTEMALDKIEVIAVLEQPAATDTDYISGSEAEQTEGEPEVRSAPITDSETLASEHKPVESAPAPAPDPEPVQQQNEIEQKLLTAREDYTARRLTMPAGNNAYEKYQSVLEMEPDNQAAHEGLQEILDLYLYIAHDSMAKGDFGHAEEILRRAATVDPQSPKLMQAHAELEKQVSGTHAHSEPAITVERDRIISPPLPPTSSVGHDDSRAIPSPPLQHVSEERSHGAAVVPSPPLPPASHEENNGPAGRAAPSPPLSSY